MQSDEGFLAEDIDQSILNSSSSLVPNARFNVLVSKYRIYIYIERGAVPLAVKDFAYTPVG